jgi:hypothetical protein
MIPSEYVEDIFIQFYDLISKGKISIQYQDNTASQSFQNVIYLGGQLTQNQANFILKLLNKYKTMSKMAGLDYKAELANPKWRTSFRTIDLSKKIFVEKDENGIICICAKFPFQLKKEFEDEFQTHTGNTGTGIWDPERRLRKLSLYDTNLIQMYEFAQRHNFEIDDTFMIALGQVEEIWQNSEDVLPYCELTSTGVHLRNVDEATEEWWRNAYSEGISSDLLLAKSMGYTLAGKPTSLIEKIASCENNTFWLKDVNEFISLCNSISGKVCILLDRPSDSLEWIKNFTDVAKNNGLPASEIKVCFRLNKEDNSSGFNQWVKDNEFGGPVDSGKIFIFNHKPAKWLFKENNDVKIIATNHVYPSTNSITKDWLNSHPCVIYLGDIKPSEERYKKIVEL